MIKKHKSHKEVIDVTRRYSETSLAEVHGRARFPWYFTAAKCKRFEKFVLFFAMPCTLQKREKVMCLDTRWDGFQIVAQRNCPVLVSPFCRDVASMCGLYCLFDWSFSFADRPLGGSMVITFSSEKERLSLEGVSVDIGRTCPPSRIRFNLYGRSQRKVCKKWNTHDDSSCRRQVRISRTWLMRESWCDQSSLQCSSSSGSLQFFLDLLSKKIGLVVPVSCTFSSTSCRQSAWQPKRIIGTHRTKRAISFCWPKRRKGTKPMADFLTTDKVKTDVLLFGQAREASLRGRYWMSTVHPILILTVYSAPSYSFG